MQPQLPPGYEMFLVFDNFWTSLTRKCSMSCHGKITCSLSASPLPPHFSYIVEACLFLSNAQHKAPFGCHLSTPLWPCPGAAQTPSVWEGVSHSRGDGAVGGQCCALVAHGMPPPCPTPSQLSAGTGALGSLC